MQTRKTKNKAKKPKKLNRKRLGLVLFYLKVFKIFKIFFCFFLLVFVVYIGITFHKNNTISKLKNNLALIYSRTMYKNICANTEINGVERANIDNIKDKIYDFCELENKNNMEKLLNEVKDDPWVKNVRVKRKLPNTLKIEIEEYLPFALLNQDNNMYLIDENGIIINISEKEKRAYYNLLIVAGEGSKENIYSLFNLLSSDPSLFSRIKTALRIGKRRWNLILDNNILIKMPEKNVLDAWSKLDKILSIRGSEIDLKVIDLRNEDKIFLEEKDK